MRVLQTLIGRADVFLTNNPRLESLRALEPRPRHACAREHPALVYGAISGYGHTGPKANRGGYDIIAQGEAGLMALTGPVDGGPSRFPSPMADISGGIYTCMGVLAALYARDNRATGTRRRAVRRRRARRRAAQLAREHRRELLRHGQAPARGSATRIRT